VNGGRPVLSVSVRTLFVLCTNRSVQLLFHSVYLGCQFSDV
jgi:hypothetical protein